MENRQLKLQLKPRAIFFIYRASHQISSKIPLTWAPAIATIFGAISYAVSAKKRRIVRANLRPVFSDGAFHERVVFMAFISYAKFWFETFKLGSMSKENVREMGRQENLDLFYDAIKDGRGVIAVAPHLGNWDFGAAWIDESRAISNAVVEALDPPELFEWFVKFRSKFGLNAIAHDDNPMPKLIDAIRRNEAVALVADRALGSATVEVEFFSRRVALPLGPAFLALRTNAPLLPMACFMEPKGGHVLRVLPEIHIGDRKGLKEDAARITQEIARAFEVLIRIAPEQWHAFSPIFPEVFDENDPSHHGR